MEDGLLSGRWYLMGSVSRWYLMGSVSSSFTALVDVLSLEVINSSFLVYILTLFSLGVTIAAAIIQSAARHVCHGLC